MRWLIRFMRCRCDRSGALGCFHIRPIVSYFDWAQWLLLCSPPWSAFTLVLSFCAWAHLRMHTGHCRRWRYAPSRFEGCLIENKTQKKKPLATSARMYMFMFAAASLCTGAEHNHGQWSQFYYLFKKQNKTKTEKAIMTIPPASVVQHILCSAEDEIGA